MTTIDVLHFTFASRLMHAGRQWRRISHAVVTAYGISAACARPLLAIARLGGGVRQIALAEYAGIQGASLVRLLDQLCAAGMVRREADPTDRRANALWLTATGKELTEKIEAKLAQLRASVFAGINKQDFEAALRILDALSLAASSTSSTANTRPADQADATMTQSMLSP